MYEPIRGGTRGGQAEFKWSDVSADKDREHYLGHSINAPTGRWQKNKDVHWYNRDQKQPEEERLAEIRQIKEAEEEAMSIALGFAPAKKNADTSAVGENSSTSKVHVESAGIDEDKLREKEERRLKKLERKARKTEKRERKEEKRNRRRESFEAEYERRSPSAITHKDRSRSRSPYRSRREYVEDRPIARRRSVSPRRDRRRSRTPVREAERWDRRGWDGDIGRRELNIREPR